jgi:hypothetical protein
MFRDAPDSYQGNVFLEIISKPGVISQFFYEGTYQQLDKIFHKGWTDKVAARLNISKGLFLTIYLSDLFTSMQRVQGFKCFDKVKAKLEAVDNDFIPTVFEVEMIEYILELFKGGINELEFAGCFKTKDEKKIDLRAKFNDNWVYFEMTKVMDYTGRSNIMRLFNLASSFMVAAQITTGKSLELNLKFTTTPNQDSMDVVVNQISKLLNERQFQFEYKTKETCFSIYETQEKPKLSLHIESESISNKLKDKYFDELDHFDGNTFNVIVIDTTYLPDDPKDLMDLTKKIFETEGEFSIISAVMLFCMEHTVEKEGFPLGTGFKIWIVFNERCPKSDALKKIFVFN